MTPAAPPPPPQGLGWRIVNLIVEAIGRMLKRRDGERN